MEEIIKYSLAYGFVLTFFMILSYLLLRKLVRLSELKFIAYNEIENFAYERSCMNHSDLLGTPIEFAQRIMRSESKESIAKAIYESRPQLNTSMTYEEFKALIEKDEEIKKLFDDMFID